MESHDSPQTDSKHRRIVMVRSVFIAVANLVPLPGVSELLVDFSRRGLIEHLAREHNVELEEGAVSALLEEAPEFQRLGILASLSKLGTLLRKQKRLRRLFTGLQLLSGVEAGFRAFEMGSMFEHYLSTAHMGQKLSEDQARSVRKTMLDASRATEKELIGDAISSLAMAVGQVALALPGYVWNRVASQGPQALSLPELSAVTQSATKLLSELRLQSYAKKLTAHFDRKWTGPAVITVSQKPN
ncbi:MAG TPA: hypothetical protein PKL17_17365 [Pseudomonadota bacterium]|jgi:hypothetical protein|nr:hypothetical protein [Pseudomonadota bacterium]